MLTPRKLASGGGALIAMAFLLIGVSLFSNVAPAGAWPAPSTSVVGTACVGGVRPVDVTFTIKNNESGYRDDPGRISNVSLVGDPTSLGIPSTLTFTPNPVPNTGNSTATASFALDPNYAGTLTLRYKFSWRQDSGYDEKFKVDVVKCVQDTTTSSSTSTSTSTTSTTEPTTTTSTTEPSTTTSSTYTSTSTSTTSTTEPTTTTSTTEPSTTTSSTSSSTTSSSTTSTTEPTTTTTEPDESTTTSTTEQETTTTTGVTSTVPETTVVESTTTTVCEERTNQETGSGGTSEICGTVDVGTPALLERLPVTGQRFTGIMMVVAGVLLGGGLVLVLSARKLKAA